MVILLMNACYICKHIDFTLIHICICGYLLPYFLINENFIRIFAFVLINFIEYEKYFNIYRINNSPFLFGDFFLWLDSNQKHSKQKQKRLYHLEPSILGCQYMPGCVIFSAFYLPIHNIYNYQVFIIFHL